MIVADGVNYFRTITDEMERCIDYLAWRAVLAWARTRSEQHARFTEQYWDFLKGTRRDPPTASEEGIPHPDAIAISAHLDAAFRGTRLVLDIQ